MNTDQRITRVYRCANDPDAILTAVYIAGKSHYGHQNLKIITRDNPEYDELCMFLEYIDVETDLEKSISVADSIRRNISPRAFEMVMNVASSGVPDRAEAIYRFLVYGFSVGRGICDAIQIPCVSRMFEINRIMEREAHFFVEFIRFREISVEPAVLLAVIEPHSHVLPYIMNHFSDRFSGEWFVILDKTHNEAAFHPKGEEYFLRILTSEETAVLDGMGEHREDYVDLWKTFFESIVIKERINPKLQRNLLPLWYRKNLTEFI